MPAQPSERDREMAQGLAAADPGCRRALHTIAQLIAFARAEGRREGLRRAAEIMKGLSLPGGTERDQVIRRIGYQDAVREGLAAILAEAEGAK